MGKLPRPVPFKWTLGFPSGGALAVPLQALRRGSRKGFMSPRLM